MAYWDDRLLRHQAIADLREASALAARVSELMRGLENPRAEEYAERTSAIVGNVLERIDMADPRLITRRALDGIALPSAEIKDSLLALDSGESVPEDEQFEHIESANNSASDLLHAALVVPAVVSPDATTLHRASRRYRDRMSRAVRETESKFGDMRNEAEEAIASLRGQLDELQASVHEASQESERITEEFRGTTGQLASNIATNSAAFDERFNNIDALFQSQQSTREARFDAQERERQNRFDQNLAGHDSAAARLQEDLHELSDEARRVLGTSAATATYGAADDEAVRQGRVADFLRYVGFGTLVVAGVVAAVLLVVLEPPANPTLADALVFFLPRIGVTGAIVGAAGYAMREAGQHRSRERVARQAAIDIASFRPFLAELSSEVRNDEIVRASRRHFFKSVDGTQGSAEDEPPSGTVTL